MQRMPLQAGYWNRAASEKRFSHPLSLAWMQQHVGLQERVLDLGCGYGRVLDQLSVAGYHNTVGTDFSKNMLVRCRSRYPQLTLVLNDGRTLPVRDRSVDAVLLFTVLTCIPGDDDQRALLAEITRVLRPGGILYISDLLINSDMRNLARYDRDADELGVYGVFQHPEGAIVRHHREDWIQQLTLAFVPIEFEHFMATTMNGNSSAAFQYLGRLPLE